MSLEVNKSEIMQIIEQNYNFYVNEYTEFDNISIESEDITEEIDELIAEYDKKIIEYENLDLSASSFILENLEAELIETKPINKPVQNSNNSKRSTTNKTAQNRYNDHNNNKPLSRNKKNLMIKIDDEDADNIISNNTNENNLNSNIQIVINHSSEIMNNFNSKISNISNSIYTNKRNTMQHNLNEICNKQKRDSLILGRLEIGNKSATSKSNKSFEITLPNFIANNNSEIKHRIDTSQLLTDEYILTNSDIADRKNNMYSVSDIKITNMSAFEKSIINKSDINQSSLILSSRHQYISEMDDINKNELILNRLDNIEINNNNNQSVDLTTISANFNLNKTADEHNNLLPTFETYKHEKVIKDLEPKLNSFHNSNSNNTNHLSNSPFESARNLKNNLHINHNSNNLIYINPKFNEIERHLENLIINSQFQIKKEQMNLNTNFKALKTELKLTSDDIFLEDFLPLLNKINFMNIEKINKVKLKFPKRFEIFYLDLLRKYLDFNKQASFNSSNSFNNNKLKTTKQNLISLIETIQKEIKSSKIETNSASNFIFRPFLLLKLWDNQTEESEIASFNGIVKLFLLKVFLKSRDYISAFKEYKNLILNPTLYDRDQILIYYFGKTILNLINKIDSIKDTDIIKFLDKNNTEAYDIVRRTLRNYGNSSQNFKKKAKNYENLAKISEYYGIDRKK